MSTNPEVATDLAIFTELTEGLEPSEPCDNPEHDQAPPAEHLWWCHCQTFAWCEDCHQLTISANPNGFLGRRAKCETCGHLFQMGPSDIRYLGPLS